jgi:NADP-dependent 3-hydroxy acid dehydrogenase YdfG
MQIKDHVFIVTGASSGIGLATAIALSDRGARVALLARSTDALQELARKLPGTRRRGAGAKGVETRTASAYGALA